MNLAIINTRLMTFEGDSLGLIKNGAVGVEDDKLTFVGKSRNIDEEDYEEIIDGSDHVTMPGLIDAHVHTSLSLLRGSAQDVPEKEWMNRALGPIAQNMDEEDHLLSSKLSIMEGLKAGTTTFAEFARDVDRLIKDVYIPFGVRVAGAETINEVVDKEGELYVLERSEDKLAKNERLFEDHAEKGLVEPIYGPQALDMVTLETLEEIKRRSEEKKRRVHMHVAQGGREEEQIKRRYGKSTVKKLDELDMIQEDLIAAHCHGASHEEKKLMAERGVNMVGCPSSISMIDGIVPPVKTFLELGGKAALGSDQTPGNGAHNIFREMRTISLLSKCHEKDPTALPAWEALKLSTKGGSEVLGLEDSVGTLKEGKKADLITVDLKKLNMTPSVDVPFSNFIPNLIYSTTGYEVDNVIVNGEEVIRDNGFVSIDEEKIRKKAEKRAEKIFSRAEVDWLEADSEMVKYQREGHI